MWAYGRWARMRGRAYGQMSPNDRGAGQLRAPPESLGGSFSRGWVLLEGTTSTWWATWS